MMSTFASVAVGMSLFCATVSGQEKKPPELTDPLEIIRRADSAVKAVKTVKYDVTVKGTGALEAWIPAAEGSVLMSGSAKGMPEKFLCNAKVKGAGADGPGEITVGWDGNRYFVVDHDSKKAYENIDMGVLGRLWMPARHLMMPEFAMPEPFREDLNGKSQELRGSKKIDGEDCYRVHVVYASGSLQTTWFFSKKDFLPRARLDEFTTDSGDGGRRERRVTNLVVEPKLERDAFSLKLPQGYTKTNEPAP